MKVIVMIGQKQYQADLTAPIDISLPVSSKEGPIAWYLENPEIVPVCFGDWEGSVQAGASTNFNNIHFNPHAHGTHTECLGHITRDFYNINTCLKSFFFVAELISITPEKSESDYIIRKSQVAHLLAGKNPQAVVIRTLPNTIEKRSKHYSHTNPPYLEEAAALYLRDIGVEHLLIDLPSVDREEDEGLLVSHKAFWNLKDVNSVNSDARFSATITEFVFVPNEITDGSYLLNLQVSAFNNDAAPSRPVLYILENTH